MGMFDSFYFADGFLPDDKAPSGYEFQTKSLDCGLDNYIVNADGSVKKLIMDYDTGRIEDKDPINDCAVIYSHEFMYDNPSDIMNRKFLGTKYQEYKIIIMNSKVAHIEKLRESGYEEPPK